MTYAMLYSENGDIVATYDTLTEARAKLAEFVGQHPELQDEIGLLAYENGRPAGDYQPAATLLEDELPQQHLV